MISKPPFYPQERDDTCALACLRMMLRHYGRELAEDELVRAAIMEQGGVDIEELARLAHHYGLQATVREDISIADLAAYTRRGVFPIVYLNRLPIDRVFAIHAVIPIRISRQFVTVLDPRRGERRISIRRFEKARAYLSRCGVICEARPE